MEELLGELGTNRGFYLARLCVDVRQLVVEYVSIDVVRTVVDGKTEEYRTRWGQLWGPFRVRNYSAGWWHNGYVEGRCENGLVVGECTYIGMGAGKSTPTRTTVGPAQTIVGEGFLIRRGESVALITVMAVLKNAEMVCVHLYLYGNCGDGCELYDEKVWWNGNPVRMTMEEICERARRGEWMEGLEDSVVMGFSRIDEMIERRTLHDSESRGGMTAKNVGLAAELSLSS